MQSSVLYINRKYFYNNLWQLQLYNGKYGVVSNAWELKTCVVGLVFRTTAAVHGGQFAIEDEAEPAVAAVGQFQGCGVAPEV